MIGLVLEGGGARGAYHAGAVKALWLNSIKFDVIAGTSVGAINGAMFAQGDYEKAYDVWKEIDGKKLFGEDFFEPDTVGNKLGKIKKFIDEKGLDTSLLKKVLEEYISEDKVRNSPVDFGLVTYDLTNLKPVEVFKDQIPEGKLLDFIMASSSLPVFKKNEIDGRTYMDGGIYNVLPINLAVDKGCKKIYAVRTHAPFSRVKKFDYDDTDIVVIGPKENLGGVLDFSRERIDKTLKMGYFDALRVLKGLKGRKYYIDFSDEPKGLFKNLVKDSYVKKAAELLNDKNERDLDEILVRLFETAANELDVERFKIYSFSGFLKEIKEKEEAVSKSNMLLKLTLEIIREF